ncbi:hypothetical protein ACFQFC_03465 [Amorphoplanes digitatis]|uniref:Uncharacterized protein n=1 Tax=Actinoplanes digitatis TaxID=1868 RepID=A0A7W7MQH4_9ACTN|nr:hypothetical protein [Actinoplanes digitatis]MBB4763236.1 hypothetical protein [Actinoplanes digitatis]GID92055.1 hypothetical protein Adi01nite_14670 [Actinoplanes digitatis]
MSVADMVGVGALVLGALVPVVGVWLQWRAERNRRVIDRPIHIHITLDARRTHAR